MKPNVHYDLHGDEYLPEEHAHTLLGIFIGRVLSEELKNFFLADLPQPKENLKPCMGQR